MKISIFGLGYVGCVGMGCLADMGHSVTGVDVAADKVKLINAGTPTVVEKDIDLLIARARKKGLIRATLDPEKAVADSELSFICVGTPNNEKGNLDMEHIYKVAEDIGKAMKKKEAFHVIAVRSTVMPGTNAKIVQIIEASSAKKHDKDFAVVSNPEFLREGSAVDDFFNPPYILIAGTSAKGLKIIEKLYRPIKAEIIRADVKVAEIIKFVNNTYHALKVSFANEIGRICKKLGVDSFEVMEIFCKDKALNISEAYFKPGFAYGGSCLPKDLNALNSMALDSRVGVPVIEGISASNKKHMEMVEKTIQEKNKRKIGFLGISFKQGTDDLRFSPALEVGEYFIGKGYNVCIYDSNINLSKLIGKNKEYLFNKFPHITEALTGSIDELIEESEIVVIVNKEKYFADYIDKNREKLNTKIIIDLIGICRDMSGEENYEGLCW
ncbi:MAG: nucleotide sugar dehydrogenase [Elusimicrobia bacterium]|nr:nucleotide sugar dehydrogenase [Elusimicrobiota bacterium]